MHLVLYALMLAVPLTGWLMSATGGYPLSFFGWFDVPDIAQENPRLFQFLITFHGWLVWTLLVYWWRCTRPGNCGITSA